MTGSTLPKKPPSSIEIVAYVNGHKESGQLTPGTVELASRMVEHAQTVIDEGKDDDPVLLTAWDAFSKLVEKSFIPQTELDSPNVDSPIAQASVRSIVILNVGDWAKTLLEFIKDCNNTALTKHQEEFQEHLEKQNLPEHDIKTLLKNFIETKALPLRNEIMHKNITSERHKVSKWREGGEDELTVPLTPFLDRLVHLCEGGAADPAHSIELIKLYNDRCEIAHHSPPVVEEFIDPDFKGLKGDERIDRKGMRQACFDKKEAIQELCKSAGVDENDEKLYMEMVDTYWSKFCRGNLWNGTIVLTDFAIEKAKNVCKRRDKES